MPAITAPSCAAALSSAQLTAYRRDGYVAVPDFFTAAEVALMRSELARLRALGRGRNVATAASAVNFQLIPLAWASPVFRSLPWDDRVLAAMTAILGPAIRQRQDQIFLKPAGSGSGTGWHQDNDYFSEFRGQVAVRGLGIWIALHDASVANGTMHVMPGMHERSLRHVRDPGSDHHVTCAADLDESQAVPIEMPAGGALFFNFGVPHCTRANRTDQDRAGLAIHVHDAAIKRPGDDDPNAVPARPNPGGVEYHPRPFLSGPRCTHGVAEYGEDQRGRWAGYVAAHAAGRKADQAPAY